MGASLLGVLIAQCSPQRPTINAGEVALVEEREPPSESVDATENSDSCIPPSAIEIAPDDDPDARLRGMPVVRVSGPTRICAGTFEATMVIMESRTSVSCEGSRFVGVTPVGGRLRDGVVLHARRPLSDYSIAGCRFERFARHGVNFDSNATAATAPSGANVLDCEVVENEGVGVFVGPWASGSVVRGNSIRENGLGIYLERESHHSIVESNEVRNNGTARGDRVSREGIAIDASHHNVIVNNVFETNDRAHISLYKNCGEVSPVGTVGIRRLASASDNYIGHNHFIGGDVQLRVAARQGHVQRCSASWYYVDEDGRTRYRDFAPNTMIDGNQFEGYTRNAIVVADAGTLIVGNKFDSEHGVPIYVGSAFLKLLADSGPLPARLVRFVLGPLDYGNGRESQVETVAAPQSSSVAMAEALLVSNHAESERLFVAEHCARVVVGRGNRLATRAVSEGVVSGCDSSSQ